MKTAIILHGWNSKEEYFDVKYPSPSNSHWMPWTQKQLLLKGISTQTPEMPDSYEPNYEKWKSVFERLEINEDTILVGHSCGGGFLTRWLSEHDVKVGKVVLVAPWLDPEKLIDAEFFNFKIDPNLVAKTDGITLMCSMDDEEDVLESMQILKTQVKDIVIQEFTDKGHFVLNSMKTDAFPELVSVLAE